jgi:hypothetical protein
MAAITLTAGRMRLMRLTQKSIREYEKHINPDIPPRESKTSMEKYDSNY